MPDLINAAECGLIAAAAGYSSRCQACIFRIVSKKKICTEDEMVERTFFNRKYTVGKKNKKKHCPHRVFKTNITSGAINWEAEKFVLTFNQTKDQRGLAEIGRRKTVSLPTSLEFLICTKKKKKNTHLALALAERWKDEIRMEINVIVLELAVPFLLPDLFTGGCASNF